jgi:hypothetical protein
MVAKALLTLAARLAPVAQLPHSAMSHSQRDETVVRGLGEIGGL